MIHNYSNEADFGRTLAEQVSPSQPIQSPEFLHGREAELSRIRKALYAPGRHVFIYGDRGVGKSSLGATAATLAQSADSAYLTVAGAPGETLQSVVASIAAQAIAQPRLHKEKKSITLKGKAFFGEGEIKEERETVDFRASIVTMSDVVDVMRQIATFHSEQPIVLVDEFDRIQSAEERGKFADLLKQLGDKGINIHFIFTGIGKSLEELLGAHASAHRQLETVELPRLSWDNRWAILLQVCDYFGVGVSRDIYVRVAAMSDGYPYYVHLLAEKLLWCAFEDLQVVQDITWAHYELALREAILSINAELRRPYERAVHRLGPENESILWATADSDLLHRTTGHMYSSYVHLTKPREPLEQGEAAPDLLDSKTFSGRVRSLTQASYGPVLRKDSSRGYYAYVENMLRGYVRMQAEANGVQIFGSREAPGEASARQKQHVPTSALRGYYASKVPPGVKTR